MKFDYNAKFFENQIIFNNNNNNKNCYYYNISNLKT